MLERGFWISDPNEQVYERLYERDCQVLLSLEGGIVGKSFKNISKEQATSIFEKWLKNYMFRSQGLLLWLDSSDESVFLDLYEILVKYFSESQHERYYWNLIDNKITKDIIELKVVFFGVKKIKGAANEVLGI